MPSNLSFPMALCRDAKKMCHKRIAETSEIGPLAKALVPNALRDLTPKYAPDRNLVCAIPRPRATAKMAVFQQLSTTSLQSASANLSPAFLCVLSVLCVERFCGLSVTPKRQKPLTRRTQRESTPLGGPVLPALCPRGHILQARPRCAVLSSRGTGGMRIDGGKTGPGRCTPRNRRDCSGRAGRLAIGRGNSQNPIRSQPLPVPIQRLPGAPGTPTAKRSTTPGHKPGLLQISPLVERPAHRQWRSYFEGKIRVNSPLRPRGRYRSNAPTPGEPEPATRRERAFRARGRRSQTGAGIRPGGRASAPLHGQAPRKN